MRVQTAIVSCCVVVTGLAGGAACISGSVLADDKAQAANSGKKVSEQGLFVQVFRLKHANLESIEEKIRSMLPADEAPPLLNQPAAPAVGGGIVGSGNGALGALGIGGGLPAFGMLGFNGGALGGGHQNLPGTQLGIGGGIAGIAGTPGGIAGIAGSPNAGALGALGVPAMPAAIGRAPSPAKWRLVSDDRTNALIFRGSPEDTQTVSEIVALADLGADDPLPKVQRVAAFQLKHAHAGMLVEKLNQLELDVRLGSLEPANIIVAIGSAAAKKDLAELIKALDVEVKPQ